MLPSHSRPFSSMLFSGSDTVAHCQTVVRFFAQGIHFVKAQFSAVATVASEMLIFFFRCTPLLESSSINPISHTYMHGIHSSRYSESQQRLQGRHSPGPVYSVDFGSIGYKTSATNHMKLGTGFGTAVRMPVSEAGKQWVKLPNRYHRASEHAQKKGGAENVLSPMSKPTTAPGIP